MSLNEKQTAFWSEYSRICRQSGATFDPVPDPKTIASPDPAALRSMLDARDREIRPPAPKPAAPPPAKVVPPSARVAPTPTSAAKPRS